MKSQKQTKPSSSNAELSPIPPALTQKDTVNQVCREMHLASAKTPWDFHLVAVLGESKTSCYIGRVCLILQRDISDAGLCVALISKQNYFRSTMKRSSHPTSLKSFLLGDLTHLKCKNLFLVSYTPAREKGLCTRPSPPPFLLFTGSDKGKTRRKMLPQRPGFNETRALWNENHLVLHELCSSK